MGGDAQLNDSLHEVDAGLLPVDESLIAADIALGGGLVHHGGDFLGGLIQHSRDILNGHTGVLFQNTQ